jgi:hypothetical protein
MQLFVAMNGCAGMGGGGWAGCLQSVHADRTTLHTMPAGLGGCLGGWGWVGGKSPAACMQQVLRSNLQCMLRGLVGWAGVGGRDVSKNNST